MHLLAFTCVYLRAIDDKYEHQPIPTDTNRYQRTPNLALLQINLYGIILYNAFTIIAHIRSSEHNPVYNTIQFVLSLITIKLIQWQKISHPDKKSATLTICLDGLRFRNNRLQTVMRQRFASEDVVSEVDFGSAGMPIAIWFRRGTANRAADTNPDSLGYVGLVEAAYTERFSIRHW